MFGFNTYLVQHNYEDLRIAYNAFLRLLDFNWEDAFKCYKCGPEVDITIMDGTAVGFNKSLMPAAPDYQLPVIKIPEYAGGDRILLTGKKM